MLSFYGQLPDLAQVEFAGAEVGEFFDAVELVGFGLPQIGQVAGGEFFEKGFEFVGREGMKNGEAFAFLFIGDAGDGEGLLRDAGEFVQLFFHANVRHHFAADLAEPTESVGDGQEPVFIQRGDVAGDIPAVADDLGGFVRPAEVAGHDVGAADEEHAGLAEGHRLE